MPANSYSSARKNFDCATLCLNTRFIQPWLLFDHYFLVALLRMHGLISKLALYSINIVASKLGQHYMALTLTLLRRHSPSKILTILFPDDAFQNSLFSPFFGINSKSKYLMASQAIKAVIGKTAPFFKANSWISATNEFKEVSLNDYKSKWLLLFFYPLDFTFVCPTEIVQFSNHAKTFRQHNCEVVGCSIDSHFVHRKWTLEPKNVGGLGGIDIPLLADIKKEIAADYGVLNDAGLALRGTFLIDNNQILKHISINDLGVGRNVPEYLRLLQAFQHTAAHGEVCPAGWTKGSASMKTKLDSSELNNYWQNVHAKK